MPVPQPQQNQPVPATAGFPADALRQSVHQREERWKAYLRLIAIGDEKALALLYDESSSLVYGLALRITGDPADAEEAVADVYTQIWKNASRFDASRGSAPGWLSILARSRALDRIRARANREVSSEENSTPEQVSGDSPEIAALLSQQREVIRAALADLSEEQRTPILLAFFEGLSHTEVAERLNQPLGTIKTRIRLGMMKLKTSLASYQINKTSE